MGALDDYFADLDALEEDKKKNPLAHQELADAPAAALNAAKNYAQTRSYGDMAKDVAMLPVNAVKGLVRGAYEQGKEIVEDPRKGVAPLAQTVGTAVGALTGNPALMILGSVAGRAAGEAWESYKFNRPYLNTQSAIETATAGFGSVIGQVGGGLARNQFIKAGTLAPKKAAELTIDRSLVPKGSDSALALAPKNFVGPMPTWDMIHRQTTDQIVQKRQLFYDDLTLKAKNAPIYSSKSMGPHGSTVKEVVDNLVATGSSFQEASKLALESELNVRKQYSAAMRIAKLGYDDTKELAQMQREFKRIEKNEAKAQAKGLPQKRTRAQDTVYRGILGEQTRAEELRRLNNTLFDNLPDYTKVNYDAFRRMMDVAPDTTKHPLLQAVEKATYPGFTKRMWRLQTNLRKDNDPHLTHIADGMVAADELYENTVREFGTKSQEFFKRKALTDEDKQFLQRLENKPELFLAAEKVDPALPKPQQLTQLQALVQDEILKEEDVGPLMRNAATIREWQAEIGDPLYAMALGLAKDASQMPPLRPSYFTSTFTYEDQLAHLKDQLASFEAKGADPNDPLAHRHQITAQILRNKITIGEEAMVRKRARVAEMSDLINAKGIRSKKLFGPQLTAKGTEMGIGLNPAEASMQYIRQTSKKMIYDRQRETADATLRDWLKQQRALGADEDALVSTARYVQDAILDQTGDRAHVQFENMKDYLRSNKVLAPLAKHVERGVKDITTFGYIANIALRPAFHGINMMQNFLTLMPLVDTASFSHALARVATDYKAAYKEALEAGALDEGLNKLWKDDALGRGISMVDTIVEKGKLDWPVQKVENRNRVMAFIAGKHNAELEGLKGVEAIKRGMDTVAESNFLYSAAHRPIGFNRPVPAAIFRYRSFGQNYGNFLGNLIRKGEYSRAGAALAAVWATSGTTGIPMFQYVRAGMAQMGVYVPEMNNFQEVTGVPLNIEPPFPLFAPDISANLGPLAGQAQAGLDIVNGSEEGTDTAVARFAKSLFAPGQRAASAVAETLRGGRTTTPSRKTVIAKRTPEQIGLSAFGFGPTISQSVRKSAYNLALTQKAKDVKARREELVRSRGEGVRNQKQQMQRNKANATNARRRTVLGEYFEGYGRY